MVSLAHLSDPHLGPLPAPRPSELASKRLLGFINWTRNRRLVHSGEVLAALVADLKMQSADHIAVTGDLANISLPQEFIAARRWLDGLGAAHDVTVVPGNHDVYVRAARSEPARNWGPYMSGDAARDPEAPAPVFGQDHAPDESAISFPFVRQRGPLALIGLTTAVPSPPLMATGQLGAGQIERLGATLAALGREPCFRVVLIHHPPVSPPARRLKRLIDSAALRATLKQHGAELLLHGHDHVHSLVWLDGPGGHIPAVGVPSASAVIGGKDDPAAYNIYQIDGAPGAWRCDAVTRGLAPTGDAVVELKRQVLAG
jgi:3',5'-cyclic AMP phosphodiesterase CpdA